MIAANSSGEQNLLVILGPTASGKTRLAVAAARALGGEIISADSRQVFRRMDIGTGKDLEEYGDVPFHLIDILEPGDEFSVFDFQQHFATAFKQVTARGRLPLLVGGTGLYLDAVLRGYQLATVPENHDLRRELAGLSLEQLRERLLHLLPEQHNTTDLLQRERLVRAIEIALHQAGKDIAATVVLPDLRPLIFGIKIERETVRRRITERLKIRLAGGMIDEVQRLLAEGVPIARLESYGLEYRYISRYVAGELNRNDMFQKLNAAIHDFAKKQENWFRKMERHGLEIIWLDAAADPLDCLLRSGGSVQPEQYAGYLARRAAVGPWRLALELAKPSPGAIVIPCLAESASLPHTLESLSADSSLAESGLAVIVVVNHRLDATTSEKEDNQLTLDFLTTSRERVPFPLGFVDAASPGFELPLKDGGVGLARKLGHDLLLPYLDYSIDPVIISLDADTLVRPGYAGAIMNHFRRATAGGAVIPFEHLAAEGEREGRAIERYELFLRCYVAGLSFAASPYGFHTVGSAMACRASAYLKCGGMNRRRAGEDFYFLQSLAKTSGVGQVKGATVYPSPRRSARVPFGTGRAMGMMLDNEPGAIQFYRPECYHLLKAWLELAMNACSTRCDDLAAKGHTLSANLGSFLEEQKFASAWQGFLGQHAGPERLRAAFHGWFDAFRTMKLFHYLAENGYPRTEPEEIVAGFSEAWGERGLSLSERLAFLRRVQGEQSWTRR